MDLSRQALKLMENFFKFKIYFEINYNLKYWCWFYACEEGDASVLISTCTSSA